MVKAAEFNTDDALVRAERREQSCCLVTIRKSDLVELAGVAEISNRTKCRLEIAAMGNDWYGNRTQAGRACATKASGECWWAGAQLRRLVTIRKSEVVDSATVAVISNCTRCRLEIETMRVVGEARWLAVSRETEG
jgi:hypothetical protein